MNAFGYEEKDSVFCRKKIILAGFAYRRDAVFDLGTLCPKSINRLSADFT
jgi:hypothetical protein